MQYSERSLYSPCMYDIETAARDVPMSAIDAQYDCATHITLTEAATVTQALFALTLLPKSAIFYCAI